MSIRTILVASLLLIAGILGALHQVTLPVWAWVVWGVLFAFAVTAWLVIRRTVGWFVRRAVLMVPVAGRVSEGAGNFSIPVSEIHHATARIESEIAQRIQFRPVAWLAARAYRMKTGDYFGGILEHCKANGSEVFDARLFASWLHEKVAETLAQSAADIASGFWMIAVIVLACLGLFFAMPHFQ